MQIKVKPSVPQTMDPDDHSTFSEWYAQANRYIERHIGVSLADLPDCPYRDWYDARVRAIRAANRALRRAGADAF